MVEEERYCVDILTQLRAARAALRRVEEAVLREHVEHCVAQAIRSGDSAEQKTKVDELLDVVGRFSD
jgi:DNA-binding FrmR family transcriptional regulator